MSGDTPIRKPGDIILDRYMPTVSASEREEARENLRRLVAALIRITERTEPDGLIRDDAEAEVD